MGKITEEDREAKNIELLTETVAQLAVAMQTQNDILLVLLSQMDVKDPGWKTAADVSKDVGNKVKQCVDIMRKTYGPSETDKS